jgi:tetratricopeptide (TPR) repeat protein
MNNDSINTDLLIQYLDGELSPEEKIQVEIQLKNNTALQQELETLAISKDAVKTFGLKQKVAAIHKEMMSEMAATEKTSGTGLVKKIIRTSMRIAASLLFVLLGFAVYQYATVSPDKLFMENYQPYTASISRGGEETNGMEKAYQQKNYAAVISQFNILTNADQKEIFLAGQAYLASNSYKKAIECFNKILLLNTANKTTGFNDDAEYYLALSYLKDKNIKSAYPLFTTIHNNSNHLYNDKVNSSFMRQLKLLQWKN